MGNAPIRHLLPKQTHPARDFWRSASGGNLSADLAAELKALRTQPLTLADGTVTTWGQASIDELRQLRDHLAKSAPDHEAES